MLEPAEMVSSARGPIARRQIGWLMRLTPGLCGAVAENDVVGPALSFLQTLEDLPIHEEMQHAAAGQELAELELGKLRTVDLRHERKGRAARCARPGKIRRGRRQPAEISATEDREARRELMFEGTGFVGRPMQQGAYVLVAGRSRIARGIPEELVEIARQRHRNRRPHEVLRSSMRPSVNKRLRIACVCDRRDHTFQSANLRRPAILRYAYRRLPQPDRNSAYRLPPAAASAPACMSPRLFI